MKRVVHSALLIGMVVALAAFSLDNSIVPREEILSGGPPKDGIPAILAPKLISAQSGDFPSAGDQVIGVRLGDETKAYPIKILTWHEVVNDTINHTPIVVTF